MRASAKSTLAAAVVAALFVPVWPGAAGATYEGVFRAAAGAHGVRAQLVVPNAPVSSNVADGGGPAAETSLDSIGESRGFASFPFPGENAATAPGLMRGLSGAPVPDYPFYVASTYPSSPEHEFGGSGLALRSESSESSSSASATSGVAAEDAGALGAASSEAVTARGEEGVVASARSQVSGFQLGPLRLGQVLSVAEVTLDPSGVRRRLAETTISGVEVNGQAVAFSGDGLTAGEGPVDGTGPDPLTEALAGTGITLEVAPQTRTDHGIAAPAVKVTRRMDSGEAVVFTLGMANAAVESPGATDVDKAPASGEEPAGAEMAGPAVTPPTPPVPAAPGSVPVPAAGATPVAAEGRPVDAAPAPSTLSSYGRSAQTHGADLTALSVFDASEAAGSGSGGGYDLAAPMLSDQVGRAAGPSAAAATPRIRTALLGQMLVEGGSASTAFGVILAGGGATGLLLVTLGRRRST